jgi:AraC family transcriptional regulator of adaptative response/methylated-DNA-[protein]-cysteine methyltransferase
MPAGARQESGVGGSSAVLNSCGERVEGVVLGVESEVAGHSSDYARVAQAIAFLRAHHRQQPDLAAVAAHLGLSAFHLQRLFSRWAGISPKRFLQFLTVEYAKRRMADTADLLSLSHQAGLSGPGRLHDLFVTMEAMSPGEFKRAATGISIRYGVHETPFGLALIAHTPRGICHLSFPDRRRQQQAIQDLHALWPLARFEHSPVESAALLAGIFDSRPSGSRPTLSVWVSGSNFQIQVWRALLQIPFARLLNYGQMAEFIGGRGAARAVGNAIAHNPVAYLIPCHRVLRQSGDFGKYRWGEERKAALVAWEAAMASRPINGV